MLVRSKNFLLIKPNTGHIGFSTRTVKFFRLLYLNEFVNQLIFYQSLTEILFALFKGDYEFFLVKKMANTLRPASPAESFVIEAFQVKAKLNRLPMKQRRKLFGMNRRFKS